MTDDTSAATDAFASWRSELESFVAVTQRRLATLSESIASPARTPLRDSPVQAQAPVQAQQLVQTQLDDPSDPLARLSALKERLANRIENA